MMRKVFVTLGFAVAVSVMQLGTLAREGHDHGVKTKKVQKSKPKMAAVVFTLRRSA